MIHIPEYRIYARIFENARTVTYRALSIIYQRPVIMKILRAEYPGPNEVAKFKREYEIINKITRHEMNSPCFLVKKEKILLMILSDFQGEPLKSLFKIYDFSLEKNLKIAIGITDILNTIHGAQIIHGGLNPESILYNRGLKQIKFIDFSTAIKQPKNGLPVKKIDLMPENLPYISPELTGRMDRKIDFRSDYYSLGVILYELFNKKLPFTTRDPLELTHCHMAAQPRPLYKCSPYIPKAISNIVAKLMMKDAKDRYQNVRAIKMDLEECLIQLQTNGKIRSFPLARYDVSSKFQISKKIYGRENEINKLFKAYDKVTQGCKQMMLITGYSGIGKTSLVHEVYKPICEKQRRKAKGWFVFGKFDQFLQKKPYSGLAEAISDLVRKILTQREHKLEDWRLRLSQALGSNGQIIVDIIPEIELLIGPQQPVPQLNPLESQNRFNLLFKNFIKVFCRSDSHLIIFLDDVQWVDSASLKLIEMMMEDDGLKYLFLICAYRDNEIDPDHALSETIKALMQKNSPLCLIKLPPLNIEHIRRLIDDSFNSSQEDIMNLVDLVVFKTGGNPFFIDEFLHSLYSKNLVEFNNKNYTWQFNMERIQACKITDNVADLLFNRIKRLNKNTQNILQIAACLGNRFDVKTLAIVTKKTKKEVNVLLDEALKMGFILPSIRQKTEMSKEPSRFQFSHDRIEQALYFLIPEFKKKVFHYKIGMRLLEKVTPSEREENIFEIVNHMNMAISIQELLVRIDELSKLNLLAAKRAKASSAYDLSLKYSKIGISLLDANSWEKKYQLSLSLYIEAAETAYLCSKFEEMENFIKISLQKAQTLLDQVKIYEIRIQSFIARNMKTKAIETGLFVLRLMGVRFPKKPNKFHIVFNFFKTQLFLIGKRIEDLENIPLMKDPYKLAIMRIFSTIAASAYFAMPKLMVLITFKGLVYSIKFGNSSVSPFAYAAYGFLLCGVANNFVRGYEFGKLALKLLKKYHHGEREIRALITVNTLITHWKDHLRESRKPAMETYRIALESGDFEYASLSLHVHSCHSLYAGKELSQLANEMAFQSEIISQLKQKSIQNKQKINQQVVENMTGKVDKFCELNGKFFNKDKELPYCLETNDINALFLIYMHEMILCYIFENTPEAVKKSSIAKKYLDGAIGAPEVPIFYFYNSLVHLAVLNKNTKIKRRCILNIIKINQKKLKKWADHAPMNYLHKYYLVEAERCRVLGKDMDAIDYYDQSIKSAKVNGYIHEEALANELAGRFYLSKEKRKLAKIYILEACYCYSQWGAIRKVKEMDNRYADLLLGESLITYQATALGKREIITNSRILCKNVDLISIIKASQAISNTKDIDKLMNELMKIVIENAGARKGLLALKKNDRFFLESSIVSNEGKVKINNYTSTSVELLKENNDAPISIINYVAQASENVVLSDAFSDGNFMNDNYIQDNGIRSILCMPISYQSVLTGILYLENDQTTGVFTPERVEILQTVADIFGNTWARKQAEEELLIYQQKLSSLSSELLLTEERERRQIAIELHDRIGHSLANAMIKIGLLQDKTPELLQENIFNEIKTIIDQTIQDSHSLTFNLSPPILYDLGLEAAVDWLVEQVREQYGIQVAFKDDEEMKPLDESFRVLIFQSVRELLFNIVKHARATKAEVSIFKDTDNIVIKVEDDGVGYNTAEINCYSKKRGGFGLFSIRERLSYMGGQIKIDSRPGQGTIVTIISPLKTENNN